VSQGLPAHAGPAVDRRALCRRIARRIVPLLFILYIISYLDRVNAGFAKLQMQDKLGFKEGVFGWGLGIFFIGYLILEIPGALLVERWSARKWFARILITWGLCSMGMALVRTPVQFYVARFLLGLAEAGFFPGVIVYFGHWFPRAERARALAGMVVAIPLSQTFGAYVSDKLLKLDWLGLDGWQWVFLVEGMPAVLAGIAVPFLMTDRPADARWLEPSERDWLERTLDAERREAAAAGGARLRDALRQPTVWLLALGILAANTGGYAFGFYLPTVVNDLLKERYGAVTAGTALAWSGVVYGCGLPGVLLAAQSSDRTGERKWHCVLGMTFAGVCLAASTLPETVPAVFVWLCAVAFFALSWPSPFWVLPSLSLSASTAAVAIAVINMAANLGGFIGSPVVGMMKDAGRSVQERLIFLAACYVLGGLILSLLPLRHRFKKVA
jgi:ACS family tartrate transporter-like MFS transporter